MTRDEADMAATAFSMRVCQAVGIQVHMFEDGTLGLIHVPAKYVAAIDALNIALACALAGEELPEVQMSPLKKARTR